MALSRTDSFFSQLTAQCLQFGASGTAFVNEVFRLCGESNALISGIQYFDSVSNSSLIFSRGSFLGRTSFPKITLQIPSISSLPGSSPNGPQAGFQGISSAASFFVGALAHELGHFEDQDYVKLISSPPVSPPPSTFLNPSSQGRYIAYLLLSEGKAAHNNAIALSEIQQTSVGKDHIEFLDYNNTTTSSTKSDFDNIINASSVGDGVARGAEALATNTPSGTSFASYVAYYASFYTNVSPSNQDAGFGVATKIRVGSTAGSSLEVDFLDPNGTVVSILYQDSLITTAAPSLVGRWT